MKTKTLLIAAAAIAAGVMTSQAQVYSQNVVGYANFVVQGGGKYTLLANPFDNGAGNSATNIVDPNGALPNKSQILTWNGSAFNIATKVLGAWNSDPTVAPGAGFFVYVPATQASDVTNTFVGSIAVASGGSVTNTIPSGYSMWGSPIPYAGDLTTDTNLNLAPALNVNKSQILTWNGSAYNISTLVQGSWSTPANLKVGDGFFLYNKSTDSTNWVERANY
jgi:hypothetical protein